MKDSELTPEQLAEQAGNMEAWSAIEAMKTEKHQGVRLTLLQDAIKSVCDSPCRDAAIAGFAVGLIAHLDSALGI